MTSRVHSGIVNHGNTCFINSALQCLCHCPSIISSLIENNQQDDKVLEVIKYYYTKKNIDSNDNNDNNDLNNSNVVEDIINKRKAQCEKCSISISPRINKINNGYCNNCKSNNSDNPIVISDNDNDNEEMDIECDREDTNEDSVLERDLVNYNINDKSIEYMKVYFAFKKLMYDLTNKQQTLTAKDFIICCINLSKSIGLEYLFDGSQNDMQEFVSFLLDSIHEAKATKTEMTVTSKQKIVKTEDKVKFEAYKTYIKHFKDKYSFIVRDFYYLLLGIIKCSTCEYVSFSYDPTCLMSVPIPKTDASSLSIYDCLDMYFGKEVFSQNNVWKCEKCSNVNNNYKEYRIITSPKTLIIAIKRFEFTGVGFRKNNKLIDFPLDLNISAYKIDKKNNCKYRLFAIGNHIGGLSGGHYISFCRDISDDENKWYCFNDHQIGQITEDKLVSNMAYMLFYQQVD